MKEHFKFPIGSKAGEKASVIVDMTIDTLGVVSDFSIRTSIDPKTDRAILNMCAFLPVFQPVVCNGRKTKTAIALLFTLKRYY